MIVKMSKPFTRLNARLLPFVLLLLLACLLQVARASQNEKIQLILSDGARPAVMFGVSQLKAKLEARGLEVVVTSKPSGIGKRIYVAVQGHSLPDLGSLPNRPVMNSPESYSVIRPSTDIVVVEGSDEAGAMYGALDVSEEIASATTGNPLSEIKPIKKSPFLAVRGVNMFLTAQGFDEPNSWYWSDDFWVKFLDMLAVNRYNFLDFHGPFDLTIGWPNGFSYFVNLKEYPELGVGSERAAKNLNRFRWIIRMAGDRGVKVGFMNYTAAAPVGPWKTGKFWVDERYVPRPQEYLAGPRLEEYTRLAVKAFLAQVPDLWMFGFRIGESGQPEDFYKKTYIEAVKDLPSSLNLYARTWVATPTKVREIAQLTNHKFFIEPKYNGEQLGLPYQAATGGRPYAPSGSYEDYPQ